MKIKYRKLIIIGSLIGSSVTVYQYLDYLYLTKYCIDGCSTVLTSQYAYLFGIPLGVWILIYFFTSICICSIYPNRNLFLIFLPITVLASIYAVILTYISLTILDTMCIYCLIENFMVQLNTAVYVINIPNLLGPRSPQASF